MTTLGLTQDDVLAGAAVAARHDREMERAVAEAVLAAVAEERARADAAEAECARLREELAAVRRAVRMLDGARAAIDANGQRVLRSLAGEERAALIEELAAARRERDDWNARATAMEAERDEALSAVAGQWRRVDDDTAFAPPFSTIRVCRHCGCLVAGGPTACNRCAESPTGGA